MKKYFKATFYAMLTAWKHIPALLREMYKDAIPDLFRALRELTHYTVIIVFCVIGPFLIFLAPVFAYLQYREDKKIAARKAARDENDFWQD